MPHTERTEGKLSSGAKGGAVVATNRDNTEKWTQIIKVRECEIRTLKCVGGNSLPESCIKGGDGSAPETHFLGS